MKKLSCGPKTFAIAVSIFLMLLLAMHAGAGAQEKPLKIGVVTFLSGAAAGPFGVPAKQAGEVVVEALNAGGKVPGYGSKGMGGSSIELVFVDEAGGTTKQVTEYRNLIERVDLVIGYISSGDCLAVAPAAEEMRKLTILFDCGTPRVFEDATYKYVFRTGATSTMTTSPPHCTSAKPIRT